MKIKQLKEKTIKGFIDFLPKEVVDNIEGLSDILNDLQTAPIENSNIDGIFV